MFKKLLLCLLICMMMLSLFAQQGKYERKSISSVESVWIKPGAIQGKVSFDYNFFDKMVKFYIENPRFDYNKLPAPLLNDFRNQANSMGSITPEALAEVMRNTIGVKIKTILEDPAIQEARAKDIKDESWGATFAGSKGKSMGLTLEELTKLMNSAYIYLPFISSMKLEDKEGKVNVTINGGIIWYQVKVLPDGKVDMQLRVATTTTGMGFADRNPKQVLGMKASYDEFTFGDESFSTTVVQYAQYDAMLAWAKNLGVKTKEIPEFKLSGQVMEVRNSGVFGFPLGNKEGLHLDDCFFLEETYEKADGSTVTKEVGFGRVVKTGNNKNDQSDLSLGKVFYGRPTQGAIVREYPRLGLDFYLKPGYQSGIKIPKDVLSDLELPDLFKKEVTDQIIFNLGFAYNLAPIINKSQTFLNLEVGYGIPLADTNDELYNAITPYTMSAYLGITKKMWFKRLSMNVNAMAGYDRFVMTFTPTIMSDNEFNVAVNAIGFKAGADVNYMVTPALQLNAGVDYKVGTTPLSTNIEAGSSSYEIPVVPPALDDIRLGGLMLRAGFSYSLGELPINIFGFLDPLKKY